LNQSYEELTEELPDVSINFFKLKKVQMQAITDQVNVAVCKQKTGGKIMTIGQLRNQGDTEKLIQQHTNLLIKISLLIKILSTL
jgi:hypothetical protein